MKKKLKIPDILLFIVIYFILNSKFGLNKIIKS